MGQRILRREDDRFLRGTGQYVENLELAGALHATFVRSPYAHARIDGIDASAASALAGVEVFTAADSDLGSFQPPPIPGLDQRMGRPYLADGAVRFVGDIVAVVLSETRAAGFDAAELVARRLRPAARRRRSARSARGRRAAVPGGRDERLHEPARRSATRRCSTAARSSSPGRLVSQRLAACPLEPRACAAVVGEDGRLTLWLSTQTPHQDRDALAMILGLEPDPVRVVAPDVGGGFGAKLPGRRGVLVAVAGAQDRAPGALDGDAQREHDRRWRTAGRRISSSPSAAAATATSRPTASSRAGRRRVPADRRDPPGFDRADGERRLRDPEDRGGHGQRRHEHDARPARSAAPGGPRRRRRSSGRWTCSPPRSGCDPAEVRRRNFFAVRRVPVHHRLGRDLRLGDYEGALDLALETRGLRRRSARSRRAGARPATRAQLGIGVSVYVEITNGARRARVRRRRDHRRTARRSCAPARSRTGRATRRRSR